jgi:hypothetical protein
MKSYFSAMLLGAAAVIIAYTGIIVVTESVRPFLMPAPALSGSVATDEKLRYLRERGPKDFKVLAVGSSITWKHLDGKPFENVGSIVNVGTAQVQVHQTRFLTHFYLDLFPDISSVLMLTSLPDYVNCKSSSSVLDEGDARAYVQELYPTSYFYLRYFVPLRYIVRAQNRSKEQQPYYPHGYWMDEYGTTPGILDVGAEYDLRYPELAIDPVCLDELGRLNAELAAREVEFNLIFTPISPRYIAKFPSAGAAVERITRHAQGLGIKVQDLYGDPRFDGDDFWDAFHMQWPAAQRMSREVARKLSAAQMHVSK